MSIHCKIDTILKNCPTNESQVIPATDCLAGKTFEMVLRCSLALNKENGMLFMPNLSFYSAEMRRIAISRIDELVSDTRREQRRSVSVDDTTCASAGSALALQGLEMDIATQGQHSNKVDDRQLINYRNGYRT